MCTMYMYIYSAAASTGTCNMLLISINLAWRIYSSANVLGDAGQLTHFKMNQIIDNNESNLHVACPLICIIKLSQTTNKLIHDSSGGLTDRCTLGNRKSTIKASILNCFKQCRSTCII